MLNVPFNTSRRSSRASTSSSKSEKETVYTHPWLSPHWHGAKSSSKDQIRQDQERQRRLVRVDTPRPVQQQQQQPGSSTGFDAGDF